MMNKERIDEIAFAAGCHRHKYWDPNRPDLEGFIINHEVLDKFAKLIVRECAEQICEGPFYAGAAAKYIKQHFGVEE